MPGYKAHEQVNWNQSNVRMVDWGSAIQEGAKTAATINQMQAQTEMNKVQLQNEKAKAAYLPELKATELAAAEQKLATNRLNFKVANAEASVVLDENYKAAEISRKQAEANKVKAESERVIGEQAQVVAEANYVGPAEFMQANDAVTSGNVNEMVEKMDLLRHSNPGSSNFKAYVQLHARFKKELQSFQMVDEDQNTVNGWEAYQAGTPIKRKATPEELAASEVLTATKVDIASRNARIQDPAAREQKNKNDIAFLGVLHNTKVAVKESTDALMKLYSGPDVGPMNPSDQAEILRGLRSSSGDADRVKITIDGEEMSMNAYFDTLPSTMRQQARAEFELINSEHESVAFKFLRNAHGEDLRMRVMIDEDRARQGLDPIAQQAPSYEQSMKRILSAQQEMATNGLHEWDASAKHTAVMTATKVEIEARLQAVTNAVTQIPDDEANSELKTNLLETMEALEEAKAIYGSEGYFERMFTRKGKESKHLQIYRGAQALGKYAGDKNFKSSKYNLQAKAFFKSLDELYPEGITQELVSQAIDASYGAATTKYLNQNKMRSDNARSIAESGRAMTGLPGANSLNLNIK